MHVINISTIETARELDVQVLPPGYFCGGGVL